MKKIIMLALVLTTIAGSAFANNTDVINQKVLTSFTKNFAAAENVKWEIRKDLYKATFKLNGNFIYAYYNQQGEQVAVSRNLTIGQLPLNLSAELQGEYQESWLTELFEVSAAGATTYYATIETSNHIVILKSDGASGWMVFKKEKK